MRYRRSLSLILLLFISFYGCNWSSDCKSGEGEIVSRDYTIEEFDAIEISTAGQVLVQIGETYNVNIRLYENLMEEMEVDVDNGKLEISHDGCFSNSKPEITITTPSLNGIYLLGSADIICKDLIKAGMMAVSVKGSGDIDLNIDADEVDCAIIGSGNIRLKGKTRMQEITIAGSGDYLASKLKANRTDAVINGSGDAELFVTEDLDVKISGSGDVKYKGNPTITQKVFGSGSVTEL